MPWISDELQEWEEFSDEEQERVRVLLQELGEDLPDDDDDHYE